MIAEARADEEDYIALLNGARDREFQELVYTVHAGGEGFRARIVREHSNSE